MQTFSTILQVSFLFCWWFPLPCRSLLLSCSSTCLFCLCFWNQISPPLPKKKKKNIAKINVKGLYCFVYFYFYGFRSFTFKSLIFVLSWFLCMAVQFHCFAWAVQYSQKLSLKRLSFLHCIFSINLFLKVFFFFSCWIENFQLYWDSVSGDNGFTYFEG